MNREQGNPVFDLQGEACPYPAMYVSAILGQMSPGEVVEILVDHLCAVEGVPAAVAQLGHRVLGTERVADGVYRMTIQKSGSEGPGPSPD